MTLQEILNIWALDSVIDKTELGDENLKGTSLHAKYLRFYVAEKTKLISLETQMRVLFKEKWEFYSLGPSKETQEKGWELPDRGAILKSDIQTYLEADKDIIDLHLKVAAAKEKVKLIEEIIKTIHSRGYLIKDSIRWTIFMAGGNG